jgi:hypothetical protein
MSAKVAFSFSVPAKMFQAEIFEILACARDWREMNYTRWQIYMDYMALYPRRQTSSLYQVIYFKTTFQL